MGKLSDAGSHFVGSVKTAAEEMTSTGSRFTDNILGKAKDTLGKGEAAASVVAKSAVSGADNLGSSIGISHQTGGRRGGSGRCCFPAKFCGSRKRKGNKRRSIRTGRCCLPVKSKKCGAKKKNGRKTKKNKRKRKSGMFNMFGGA